MTAIPMNEGKYDRFGRVILGAILVATGIALWGTLGLVVGIIGLIPLITGLTGWCPLYALFKINTCPFDK